MSEPAEAVVDDPRELRMEMTKPVDVTEPLKSDITFGAFSNPLIKDVLRKFGKNAFARSSACMEFEAFLKRIHLTGTTALEIGTYQGITAIILSQYFEHVICVSVDEDMRRIIKRDIVEYLGLQKKIEFYDVKNNAQKAMIVNALKFDFAYSDGDHVNDTYSDFKLVKRCGRVLQHEAWPLQPGPWNLMHSLPPEEVVWAHYDCLAYWEHGWMR